MLILAIFTTLTPYMVDSISWKHTAQNNCQTYWWANLLYINNVIDSKNQVHTRG